MKRGTYIRTPEIREKQRKALLKTVVGSCVQCGKEIEYKPARPKKFCSRLCRTASPETRKNMSIASRWKGKKLPAHILKNRIGRKNTIETRKKMSESAKRRVAEGRHHNYKGGITYTNEKIRHSLEYRLWRESVFKRDGYTCVWCGTKRGPFNADHIKPFAFFPELRFAIDNGRTLCVPCHKTTPTYQKHHA